MFRLIAFINFADVSNCQPKILYKRIFSKILIVIGFPPSYFLCNSIYNKIFGRNWFSVCLFVSKFVIDPSNNMDIISYNSGTMRNCTHNFKLPGFPLHLSDFEITDPDYS